ncbi:MAG: acid phosphatase [Gemmatimonadetes bacterium]|nr:MAG: acid phosphatase [Gemmatimonadota bacterium]
MSRLRIVLPVLWLFPACQQAAGPAAPGGGGAGAGGGGTIPVLGHVFIVVEENTDYADVIGTSAMPYLDSLAGAYGLATQYYADTHPSIGNYFMMTVGETITNDDSYNQTVASDNIVRHLVAAGKTWKAYAEDLPSAGDVTLDLDNGSYASRHNPLVYLTDVHDDAAQAQHVVPFTQFTTDLSNNTFPNYAFIVPNLCNDAHDCSLGTADTWLRTNIDPLVRSAALQQNGVLIILFDESGGDNTHGGGRVVWVVVGTKVKHGYQSTTTYQHASTLRLSAQLLGLTSFPNLAATAPDVSEFFTP